MSRYSLRYIHKISYYSMSLIKKLWLSVILIILISSVAILGAERNTKLQVQYWWQDRFAVNTPHSLFVGSSTIARFPVLMASACGYITVRGFENGLVSHVQRYLRFADTASLKNIVMYVGENDIANDASVDDLLLDVESLLQLTQNNSEQKVAFMSIKDSPRRARFHSQFAVFNQRLTEITSQYPHASIIPLHNIQSSAFYLSDGVHLNRFGYENLANYVNDFCNDNGKRR